MLIVYFVLEEANLFKYRSPYIQLAKTIINIDLINNYNTLNMFNTTSIVQNQ